MNYANINVFFKLFHDFGALMPGYADVRAVIKSLEFTSLSQKLISIPPNIVVWLPG